MLSILSAAVFLVASILPLDAGFGVSQLNGFNVYPAAGGPVVITFASSATLTNNATTYTFTAAGIGTASSDRLVVVSASGNASSDPNSNVSSLTIGGNAATIVDQITTTGGGMVCALYYLLVTSGTTADIAVTFGEGQSHAAIGVWAITGWGSQTPTDSDKAQSSTGVSQSLSTVTIDSNGGAVFGYGDDVNAGTTWTNATEDYDDAVEAADQQSGAHTTTAGTPTVTADGATGNLCMVGAAWGP